MANRTVFWSQLAENDFREITDYYQENTDEVTTYKILKHILDATKLLGNYNIGRKSRMNGLYEKSVSHTSYIIAYRFHGDFELEIVRLIHASQNWTSSEFPKE